MKTPAEIAAAIRARPHDYERNNALTASLTAAELHEVARLIDAQAVAVQDAAAAQEEIERRAAYRRRPLRRRAAAPQPPQFSFGVSLLAAVMLFAWLAVSWRAAVVIVAVVALVRGWAWLCMRHPYVAIALAGFLRGLLGGRR